MQVPRMSVIIPSRDGYRDGCVPRLLRSVEAQGFTDYETIIIKGVFPQGKAINQGAAQSRGEWLVVLDDDTEIADESVFQRLADAIEADPSIGIAGASIVLPPHASRFQRWASTQFPRFNTPVVDEVTDSDFACHGCCLIPRQVFDEIGGEREDIIRGLDPDLRVRIRRAGGRVVLVPHAQVYHPLPDGLGRLVRVFFRNGFGSAYAWRFSPESVYETGEVLDMKGFQPRRPFVFRLVRFPLRLLWALLQGKLLRFVAYSAYAWGYGWGLLTAKKESIGAGR